MELKNMQIQPVARLLVHGALPIDKGKKQAENSALGGSDPEDFGLELLEQRDPNPSPPKKSRQNIETDVDMGAV